MKEPYKNFPDRKERWKYYFHDETSRGPAVMKCIMKKNPKWTKKLLPNKISEIYKTASEVVHITSNEMHLNPKKEVKLSAQLSAYLINVMVCISDEYGLTIIQASEQTADKD